MFSIIIPVYNAEKTLRRCLDSLLDQDVSQAEIILIDDGSKDSSLKICQEYTNKYSSVFLFSQSNNGVSSARNNGLERANGEYVLFVDSDDSVSHDYLKEIERKVLETRCDFLLFGSKNGDNTNSFCPNPVDLDDRIKTAQLLSTYMKAGKLGTVWGKVFRNEIIARNNLRFPEQLTIAEDLTFIVKYLMNIKNVSAIPEILYYVDTNNQNSLSRKIRKDLYRQLRDASLTMIEEVKSAEISEQQKRIYLDAVTWLYYRSVYSSSKEVLKYLNNRKEQQLEIRRICDYYSDPNIGTYSLKTKIMSLPVRLRAYRLVTLLVTARARK